MSSLRDEKRRYNRSIFLLMSGYGLALLGVNSFFANHAGQTPQGISAIVIAALPALPVIGVFVVMGRFLARMTDEYLRMLLARQMLIATGLTLSVATAWGFVESFGLAAHVPAYYAAILWFGGLGLGGCVNRWLERAGERP